MITEVTVRLHPIPESVSAGACAFDSIQGAVDTVIRTIQLGIPVARLELLDAVQLDAINRYSQTTYPVPPTLFFELHGPNDRCVAEQAEEIQAIAADNGGHGFQLATGPGRHVHWRA